jgi:hypothetical protein
MRRVRIVMFTIVLVVLLATGGILGTSARAVSAPRDVGIGNVSTRFSASRDGFAFINHAGADTSTLLGKALIGICGGMSYAALDYYYQGSRPATSGIDAFLLRRDVQSLVANGGSFALWSIAPDEPDADSDWGVATATRCVVLPQLAEELRRGPVPLGLVKARDLGHIGRNHQVVAYGLTRKGSTVTVRIYDPNHPGSDDTLLSLDLARGGRVLQYSGGAAVDTWRGFFIEHYAPARPPRSR